VQDLTGSAPVARIDLYLDDATEPFRSVVPPQPVEVDTSTLADGPHVLRLEARPKNIEGEGEIAIRDLVKNSLRMRPDRIVIGEVRGAEALDMLQAMNTGHDGSLSTLHANTPRDALARLETMVMMAGYDLPLRAIREQIASAIDLLIQIERMSDGCAGKSQNHAGDGRMANFRKRRKINQRRRFNF